MSYWATAQQEANIWYFGDFAGLDFTSGAPTALTNGSLNTEEACAIMCDPQTGDLLFYTNGISVWDATHNIMPNGSGLWGHPSTTQTAIVPHPGDTDRYYIFTAPSQVCATYSCSYDGLAYSVVDMAMNGGLGDVMVKNQPLYAPTTEKIAVARHANCRDYWLISHRWNSNLFYVFKIDTNGLDTNAVTSSTGLVHSGSTADNFEAIGYMKASTDYQQVALAVFSDPGPGIIELFDFNNATGVLSNPLSFSPGGSITSGVYGVSFSPDNTKIYVSTSGDFINTAHLLQYNLTAGNIPGSQNVIQSTNNDFGALQLAPDGKIYLARPLTTWLAVIQNPNRDPANNVGYVNNGAALSGNLSSSGLPNVIFPPQLKLTFEWDSIDCENKPVRLKDSSYTVPPGFTWAKADQLFWSLGDGSTQNGHNPEHQYGSSGVYTITLTGQDTLLCLQDTHTRTLQVLEHPVVATSTDKAICQGDTTSVAVTNPSDDIEYQWLPANTLSNSTALNPLAFPEETTIYTVTATDTSGCIDSAGQKVTVYKNPTPAFEPHPEVTTLDQSDIFFENLTDGGTLWQWSFGTGNMDDSKHPTYRYEEPGTYEVELMVTDTNGCTGKALGTVLIYPELYYGMPNAFSPNGDGLNDVFIGKGELEGIQSFRMEVWNRWGELVFKTDDPHRGWKGVSERSGIEAPSGTYYYRITVIDFAGQAHPYEGYVYLIR